MVHDFPEQSQTDVCMSTLDYYFSINDPTLNIKCQLTLEKRKRKKNMYVPVLILSSLTVMALIKPSIPLEMVRAGDHCDRRMSRQMLPLLLIFGW